MELTWTELITVPGAAAAAVALIKLATKYLGLPTSMARTACLIAGIAILEAATLVTSGSLAGVIAAIPAGVSAGLAAIAAYDSAVSGFDYRVEQRV